jgi:tetratricopeptide (TPR) repeat protein
MRSAVAFAVAVSWLMSPTSMAQSADPPGGPSSSAPGARAIAALEGLTPPPTSPPPGPPLASPARRREAEAHFDAGRALSARGQHAEAAAAYLAAVERDPARVDALLRAGLSFRRAGRLDEAIAAYDRAVAHERATAEQRLDGTYGLGETWRLCGDVDRALDHFRRYVDGETRPSEVRFVERARAVIVELEARAPAARQAAGASPAFVADAFFGDGAVVDALLVEAAARRGAGDEVGAATLLARARALAPDDPRVAPPPVPRCDVERLLGRGEAALAKQDGPGARLAFERALACDPARSAPLWGLSRAADLVGDRVAGRHHARRYLEAKGPDRDAATARAAFWRSEQP